MLWQEILHASDLYQIQTAVLTPTLWILRGTQCIYGYDPALNQIAWEITDVDKNMFHVNHEMAHADGVVAASVFFGREEKRAWVYGYSP